jgi:hypothetical protein
MKNIYININNEQKGPFELTDLKNQKILNDTLVWAEGMTDWKKASEIEELKSYIISAPPPPVKKVVPPPIVIPTPPKVVEEPLVIEKETPKIVEFPKTVEPIEEINTSKVFQKEEVPPPTPIRETSNENSNVNIEKDSKVNYTPFIALVIIAVLVGAFYLYTQKKNNNPIDNSYSNQAQSNNNNNYQNQQQTNQLQNTQQNNSDNSQNLNNQSQDIIQNENDNSEIVNLKEMIIDLERKLTNDPNDAIAIYNMGSTYKNIAGIKQRIEHERCKNNPHKPENPHVYIPDVKKSAGYFEKALQTTRFKDNLNILKELSNIYDVLKDNESQRELMLILEKLEYSIPEYEKENYLYIMLKLYNILHEEAKQTEIDERIKALKK